MRLVDFFLHIKALQVGASEFNLLTQARFWGWTENAREIVKDRAEMKAKLRKGESLYGETPLPPHIQEAAARNSRYSALKFCKTSSRDLTNGSYHAMV